MYVCTFDILFRFESKYNAILRYSTVIKHAHMNISDVLYKEIYIGVTLPINIYMHTYIKDVPKNCVKLVRQR